MKKLQTFSDPVWTTVENKKILDGMTVYLVQREKIKTCIIQIDENQRYLKHNNNKYLLFDLLSLVLAEYTNAE